MEKLGRDIIIQRLSEDLVGPYANGECLEARPSDIYLTGILWPRGAKMGAADDERLGYGGGSGTEGDDMAGSGEEEEISLTGLSRPCTAGISFAVSSIGKPSLTALISFGTYSPEEKATEKKKTVKSKEPLFKDTLWKREPHNIPVPGILVDEKSGSIIELDKFGGREGIWLHIKTARWSNNWLVTITLVNDIEIDRTSGRKGLETSTLFQVKIDVLPDKGTTLIARPSRRATMHEGLDEEEQSTELLYRNVLEYAVGHTCSAEWEIGPIPGSASKVSTTWIPKTIVYATSSEGHPVFNDLRKKTAIQPLSAKWLSSASDKELLTALSELPAVYGKWIELQEKKLPNIPDEYREQARRNLERCKEINKRMEEGATNIGRNPGMAEAFRLANRAMQLQYGWARDNLDEPLIWRPFQLGFILLSADSVAKKEHTDRNIMDLLWFPTGGGKTEAYLALIAFLSFYRRLSQSNPDEGDGVAAIMRYTLRLLTTQQFARASSMILACEAIRRGKTDKKYNLGKTPFSIGLWVGGDATPNRCEDAIRSINGSTDLPSPKQLAICPACKTQLRWYHDVTVKCARTRCENAKCILSAGETPLPVFTVDDDIYRERPTLLIGTIDKFAQIVRREEVNQLFNIRRGAPPDLIIQDELHLISGPLGTVAGLYEAAIDMLFTYNDKRPKIIGSTATIRRANEQVKALFYRETCQFPPPAVDSDDSGFAVIDKNVPGRLYTGITTAGRSAKFTLQGVSASLLQSANCDTLDPISQNYYWTLVSYFNSLRELGGAVVLMEDDVKDSISMIAKRRAEKERDLENIKELTSRRTQKEVRDMLDELAYNADDPGVLDIVLATNMLSVGVDIPRLGLMLVNGQPKGISEYIQATSRVGRGKVPGLIVAVLNNAKARDRSHYESFATWHNTLYRDVEATSVTPFAPRARDRVLHATLVALVRHLVPDMLRSPLLDDNAYYASKYLVDYLVARAKTIDPEEITISDELTKLLMDWRRREPEIYWASYRTRDRIALLQDAEKAATQRAMGQLPGDAWPTMNNMRSVEPSVRFRLVPRLAEQNEQRGDNGQ